MGDRFIHMFSVEQAAQVAAAFAAASVEVPQAAADLIPGFNVVQWVRHRHAPVTVDCICARWGVSRATAYRWLKPLQGAQS